MIGIIAAIAVPGLLRVRESGNEASALASLRVDNSAQQVYLSSCSNGFYAASLVVLNDPPSSGGTPFISPDLGAAVVVKTGYRLTMAAGSEATSALVDGCNASGTAANLATSYYATNQPLMGGITPAFRCSNSYWRTVRRIPSVMMPTRLTPAPLLASITAMISP